MRHVSTSVGSKEFDESPLFICLTAHKQRPNFEGAHITAITNVLKYLYAQKYRWMCE
jgi:hypothetical protein